MRLITVLMKEETSKIRNEETTKLLDYGFTNYKIKTIFSTNDSLGTIEIFNSKNKVYDLKLVNDATNLEHATDNNNYTYNIKLMDVKAPLKMGDKVGDFEIISNGKVINTIDVTVKEDALKANLWDLFKRNMSNVLIGN